MVGRVVVASTLAVPGRLAARALADLTRASAGDSDLRVGVDVVDIDDVDDAIARFGPRYLHRLFTRQEVGSCPSGGRGQAAGLAARFAAKEATVKVLRPAGQHPGWRSVEVLRHPSGSCSLALHGRAAELAGLDGLTSLAVSLSHEGSVALAVVVARGAAIAGDDGPPPPPHAQTGAT